jgi:phosphoserine phosphatase RsbU/P
MKFRTRLLILLLAAALVPLSLSFLSQRTSILYFGNKLASNSKAVLSDSASTLLLTLVNDYSRILKRDKEMALLALQLQADAVEKQFSSPLPTHQQKVYFSIDYLISEKEPRDLVSSPRRQRVDPNGKLTPIPISYSQQVIFLSEGTSPEQIPDELTRMSYMVETYIKLHNIQPELFLWQYTALESGLHSSYPGKGGYPSHFDPRKRPWYQETVRSGTTSQVILNDLSTGQLILTLAKPLYTTDGDLLGVTAVDIDYQQFFVDWEIPGEWSETTESMILTFNASQPDSPETIEVLLRNDPSSRSVHWQIPVTHEFLNINDPALDQVKKDMINGQSAVRKITYKGKTALWAYGPRTADTPFPLIILPYDEVLAKAVNAEKYINQQIDLGLKISAVLTIFVVLATIFLAIVRAKKVTDPVMKLADAATRLADGDFGAKVDIRNTDEFIHLGKVFNSLGDSLLEREQMKQSLALAKEIQQELLPAKAPQCPGFDIAGVSRYCDETGGDYYDFITLREEGTDCLGIAIGDVTGHGIGSALVMAAARGILRTLADHNPLELTPLFSGLNRHLSHDTADDCFMTLFYGVLNPSTRRLCWISAGQAPIFLYQNKQITELGSSAIPLGIVDNIDYGQTSQTEFSCGDILLLGTDGIWETRNADDEMFGTERLKEIITNQADQNADSIAHHIIDALNDFRGQRLQDDDITLVVIKAIASSP